MDNWQLNDNKYFVPRQNIVEYYVHKYNFTTPASMTITANTNPPTYTPILTNNKHFSRRLSPPTLTPLGLVEQTPKVPGLAHP